MTGYVTCRWYRAPEIVAMGEGAGVYTNAVDMWSAGCVLAELMTGRTLFQGSSNMSQLVEILKALGSPSPDYLATKEANGSDDMIKFLTENGMFKDEDTVGWRHTMPASQDESMDAAIDLLDSLIKFDARERLDAAGCLAHPYFEDLADPDDEPEAEGLFDESFETFKLSSKEWEELVHVEVADFQAHFAAQMEEVDGDAWE